MAKTNHSLLDDNFYPVTSQRRVEKESDELLYTARSFVMVRNGQPLALERRATHVDNSLPQNCNIFSVLSIFKYNPGKTGNKFITSSIIPIQRYHSDEFQRKRKLGPPTKLIKGVFIHFLTIFSTFLTRWNIVKIFRRIIHRRNDFSSI